MRYWLVPTVLVLLARPSSSQTPAEFGTPLATAQAVLQADSLRDWRLLLALAHPDALEERKRDQLEELKFEGMSGMPRENPCMAKRLQQWNRMLLDSVYRVATVDELSRLPAESIFARDQRFFARQFPRHYATDSLDFSRTIVGSVLGDDSTAYVVIQYTYRRSERPPGWPARDAKIMTLRRYRGDWRSMLDPDLGETSGGIALSGEDCE